MTSRPLLFLLPLLLAACFGPPDGLPDAGALGEPDRIAEALIGEGDQQETIRIAAWLRGDDQGRPVIFVHGTPGSASVWADLMAAGDTRFQMIAIDRPGFGASEPRRAVVPLADQARALLPFLEEMDGRLPILVGHSLGGPIVAKAAALYPDKIAGIVLVAGAFDPALEKVYAIQHLGDSFLLRWALPRHLKNANEELIGLEPELEILVGELRTLRLPVAVVHGTKDEQVPYANVAFLERTLSEDTPFTLVRLDGENHFLPWRAIGRIWDAIRAMDAAAGALAGDAAPQSLSSSTKE